MNNTNRERYVVFYIDWASGKSLNDEYKPTYYNTRKEAEKVIRSMKRIGNFEPEVFEILK